MAKKGPLGKAEVYYIEHHREEHNVDTLAKDLDRTKSSITKYLKDHPSTAKSMLDQSITRHKGGAVMTESASSISDIVAKKGTPLTDSCTTTIKK
tara:strand:- start:192 stop:476 length:285 start_codon:yes stop_codon:yes gene_type:complete